MTVRAKDVLDSETLKMVGSFHNQRWYRDRMAAKKYRAESLREAQLNRARLMFPNVSDYEAMDMLREWDEEHQ